MIEIWGTFYWRLPECGILNAGQYLAGQSCKFGVLPHLPQALYRLMAGNLFEGVMLVKGHLGLLPALPPESHFI